MLQPLPGCLPPAPCGGSVVVPQHGGRVSRIGTHGRAHSRAETRSCVGYLSLGWCGCFGVYRRESGCFWRVGSGGGRRRTLAQQLHSIGWPRPWRWVGTALSCLQEVLPQGSLEAGSHCLEGGRVSRHERVAFNRAPAPYAVYFHDSSLFFLHFWHAEQQIEGPTCLCRQATPDRNF